MLWGCTRTDIILLSKYSFTRGLFLTLSFAHINKLLFFCLSIGLFVRCSDCPFVGRSGQNWGAGSTNFHSQNEGIKMIAACKLFEFILCASSNIWTSCLCPPTMISKWKNLDILRQSQRRRRFIHILRKLNGGSPKSISTCHPRDDPILNLSFSWHEWGCIGGILVDLLYFVTLIHDLAFKLSSDKCSHLFLGLVFSWRDL